MSVHNNDTNMNFQLPVVDGPTDQDQKREIIKIKEEKSNENSSDVL